MAKDVSVSKILNIYFIDTTQWARRIPQNRNRAGLVLFTEGEIEYRFPHQNLVASKGTVMFFPANVPYNGVARTKRVAYFVLDFDTVPTDESDFFNAPYAFTPDNFDELYSLFYELTSAWEQQKLSSSIRAKAFIYSVVGRLMEKDEQNNHGIADSDVLSYIFENYTNPALSVNSLCKTFYISQSQLRRNVLKATGLSPNEYITSLRITRAKKELICSQKTVKQLAADCGFLSAYYFSRCFHKHTGVSPSAYRESFKITES